MKAEPSSRDYPLLCPLHLLSLEKVHKGYGRMLQAVITSYISGKLQNEQALALAIANNPNKHLASVDAIVCLTFENQETVGFNPFGDKMRLIIISREHLMEILTTPEEEIYISPDRPFSKMRLQQLRELAEHVNNVKKYSEESVYSVVTLYYLNDIEEVTIGNLVSHHNGCGL